MALEGYWVSPTTNKLAQEIVVSKHYLHRRASCSFAFGLFDEAGLRGVIMFGSPVSSTLCRGICGPEYAPAVIELTRLWVDDSVPRNGETFLIGRAVQLLPKHKSIIVSFADPSVGHVGTIYQAANFLYTGLGPPRKKWQRVGDTSQHFHRSMTSKMSYAEAKEQPGLEYVPAVRKHRYILLRDKRLRQVLRYPVMPYPKLKNVSSSPDSDSKT